MFLPILLLPRSNKLSIIYPYNSQIWRNIFDIILNIWEQQTNKLTKIITIITHYLHQVIIGDILFAKICLIPAILSQNIYDQCPSTYFFAVSHDQEIQKFHDMTHLKQAEILANIKSDYQEIMINYFLNDKNIPEKIDKFINILFCANIPVPQIIEMHMEIIDEFAKQLKLEGRGDETLLDYRLTLIDILANLCELYRCSLVKPES
ncbi:KaiA family protein [Anabaena sp. FACHB-1237]|uniref:KaiA family protein n=1 Tax=Anabaena sp. FACHB-1237 TaxID=2692769 RepID=UPI0016819806|nr:KaiA family protein [Anabaena sp. FACHB-1237]MBD2139292.1 KaiA family protein [Anabaena sp. FACHB-1237]